MLDSLEAGIGYDKMCSPERCPRMSRLPKSLTLQKALGDGLWVGQPVSE